MKLSRYVSPLVSNNREEMSRFLKGSVEHLEEECGAAMLHASMGLSRLMVHVKQVEENRNRKHTRAGNRSRQVEKKFSRKSSTEIRDKTRFKKGLSSKDCYDRDSKSRLKSKKCV